MAGSAAPERDLVAHLKPLLELDKEGDCWAIMREPSAAANGDAAGGGSSRLAAMMARMEAHGDGDDEALLLTVVTGDLSAGSASSSGEAAGGGGGSDVDSSAGAGAGGGGSGDGSKLAMRHWGVLLTQDRVNQLVRRALRFSSALPRQKCADEQCHNNRLWYRWSLLPQLSDMGLRSGSADLAIRAKLVRDGLHSKETTAVPQDDGTLLLRLRCTETLCVRLQLDERPPNMSDLAFFYKYVVASRAAAAQQHKPQSGVSSATMDDSLSSVSMTMASGSLSLSSVDASGAPAPPQAVKRKRKPTSLSNPRRAMRVRRARAKPTTGGADKDESQEADS